MQFPEEATQQEQGSKFAEYILGGQDGLVNVLGLVLGVASATNDSRIVIISGLAGLAAETISMAAVAYTSTRAAQDYYNAQVAREHHHVTARSEAEKKFMREIYYKKGFRGRLLSQAIEKITGNKDRWVNEIVKEEIGPKENVANPLKSAWIVGVATLIGSIIPLIPFFFMPVTAAIITSLLIGTAVLFSAGYLKSKFTIGNPWKNGIEMALIGTIAALAGYGVGLLL